MKTFFKDEKTIIINSMDYTETLVGKAFLNTLNTNNQTIKVEQRNDINDDFDGFVLTITDKPVAPNPEEIAMNVSVLDNNYEAFRMEIAVPVEEGTEDIYILTDFDETKVGLFIDYLEDMGVTDVNFGMDGTIYGENHNTYVEGEYTIPAGFFTFYKVNSDIKVTNNATLVKFVETNPIIDTEAPVITLIGPESLNVLQNAKYLDTGATAFDDRDGDITSKILVDSNVDTSTLGEYEVKYNVVDLAGNQAETKVRKVSVVETM